MKPSAQNIKLKIALHSFGGVLICLILFLLSLFLSDIPTGRYLMGGLLTAAILRIIFSQKKYLTSIEVTNDNISIQYLNRMLFPKNVTIDKTDLNILDVKETNWWTGELDLLNFSNKKQDFTFASIDKKLKQFVIRALEQE